jgi:hypothetical protein
MRCLLVNENQSKALLRWPETDDAVYLLHGALCSIGIYLPGSGLEIKDASEYECTYEYS